MSPPNSIFAKNAGKNKASSMFSARHRAQDTIQKNKKEVMLTKKN